MPPPAPTTDIARLAPYIEDLSWCSDDSRIPPSLVAAIVLRESLAGWARGYFPVGTHLGWGDFDGKKFNAFGLGQADERYNRSMLESGFLLTPRGQFTAIATKVKANLNFFTTCFPALDKDRLLRAAIAAYNASMGAVANQLLTNQNVDLVTTGSNYSDDVMKRKAKLDSAGIFQQAIPIS